MTDPSAPADLDLHAYLRRIGYAGDLAPARTTLDALHLAHATHIPFENLDILRGVPIKLDLASLQAKLVAGGRGGYCFEQNRLFAAVLIALGFAVTPLAARVRLGSDTPRPRTHMTLRVDVDGVALLADVGFGASGPLLPVPFGGAEARQSTWTFRVADERGTSVLQARHGGPWEDLYAFTQEPQQWIDYELPNWYTSTHPESRFTRILTAQRLAPEVRCTLRNRDYIEDRGDTVSTRLVTDDDELLRVLAEVFGLAFPPGTRFAYDPEAH